MSYGGPVSVQQLTGPLREIGLKKALTRVRQANADGSPKSVIGSWHMIPGASLARFVAGQGWDFVLIDTEHGNVDDGEMHTLVTAVGSVSTCSPIVRVAASDPWLIKRALDTGAHGIMCPMISTAAEAKRLVAACRFPPKRDDASTSNPGIRGVGSPYAPLMWERSMQEYMDTANDSITIIAQIENREGLAECEAIAAVEGIDMLFVGPNDLASSMGLIASQHEDYQEVQEAIERIRKAAHQNNKYAGMFCTSPEQVLKRATQGFDFLNCGVDITSVLSTNANALHTLRELR